MRSFAMIQGIEDHPDRPTELLIGALPNDGADTDAMETIRGYLYWVEKVSLPLSSHIFSPTFDGPTEMGVPSVEANAH